jgi:hypothetical protein
MDETYVRIKGQWKYLYRAVDKEGLTIDFLLTLNRDRDAAEAFLRKAIRTQGLPERSPSTTVGRIPRPLSATTVITTPRSSSASLSSPKFALLTHR